MWKAHGMSIPWANRRRIHGNYDVTCRKSQKRLRFIVLLWVAFFIQALNWIYNNTLFMIDNKTLISHFSFDQPFVNRSFSLLRKHRGSRYKASLDDRSKLSVLFFSDYCITFLLIWIYSCSISYVIFIYILLIVWMSQAITKKTIVWEEHKSFSVGS